MKRSINNNYNLDDYHLSLFKEMFSYTRGKDLQIKFGLSLNEIQLLRKKFYLKKNKNIFTITPDEIEKFRIDFFNHKNDSLMKKYRLTKSQLNYLRGKLQIRKR